MLCISSLITLITQVAHSEYSDADITHARALRIPSAPFYDFFKPITQSLPITLNILNNTPASQVEGAGARRNSDDPVVYKRPYG